MHFEPMDLPASDPAGAAAAALALDLWLLRGEAMGWQPLGQGAYWHGPVPAAARPGDAADAVPVVHVVGCPDPDLAGLSVLLLT